MATTTANILDTNMGPDVGMSMATTTATTLDTNMGPDVGMSTQILASAIIPTRVLEDTNMASELIGMGTNTGLGVGMSTVACICCLNHGPVFSFTTGIVHATLRVEDVGCRSGATGWCEIPQNIPEAQTARKVISLQQLLLANRRIINHRTPFPLQWDSGCYAVPGTNHPCSVSQPALPTLSRE